MRTWVPTAAQKARHGGTCLSISCWSMGAWYAEGYEDTWHPLPDSLTVQWENPVSETKCVNAQKTRKQVQHCRHIVRTMKSDSSNTESPRRSACYLIWSTWNKGQWAVTYNDKSWQSGFWLERGEDARWESIYRNLLMHWKSGYRSKIFDGGMHVCVKVYWTVLYTY